MADKKPPNQPGEWDWQKDLGKINSSAATTTGERLAQLQKAFSENLGSNSSQLNQLRQNEIKSNKKFYRKALGKITSSTNAALASLGQRTALENQIADSASSALAQPQDRLLQGLNAQAESDLALGRSLSPQEEREAVQQSRAATSARGFGSSAPGAFAEVLNRDRYGTQREAMRREFASSVEGQNQSATNSARGFSTSAAQLGQSRDQFGSDAAKFRYSSNPGVMAASQTSMVPTAAGFTGNLINQADVYPQVLGYAAGVQEFNQNAKWNQYINEMNRYYAEKAGSGTVARNWLQRAMNGAQTGAQEGSIGGPWGSLFGAAGGAVDGAANGPIYQAHFPDDTVPASRGG